MTDEYLHTALNDLADTYSPEVVLAEARRMFAPTHEALDALPDHGKFGAVHPQTSIQAAATAKVKNQRKVLADLLDSAGAMGLTCYEAAHKIGMVPNQVATRMMELREAGYAVRLEARRPTTPGNSGHVHVAARWIEQEAEADDQGDPKES